MNNQLLSCLFVMIMALCALVSIRWSLSLHAYTLMDNNFKEARIHSVHLLKRRYISTVIYLVLWQFALFVVALLLAFSISGIAVFVIKLLTNDIVGYGIAIQCVSFIVFIVYTSLFYFSVPISFALLSSLYYAFQEDKNVDRIPYCPQRRKQLPRYIQSVFVVVFVCTVVISVYNAWELEHREANIIHELREVPEITAHRGDSVHAPENSIPAFEKAMEAQADWIELDVHQTKDGVVVVTHDADLKRIANVDKNIYDITYEELLQYDVGSWFSKEYEGLRVATLDEVIKLCKGNVKLNIEIKPTGNEKNFEQNVIDIINKHDFRKDCVVASLNEDALKEVKRLDKTMPTLYIMSVALGNVSDITFADNVSVEASFITSDLLDSVHKKGKKLTAWTVNQEENVKHMIDLGVDNIITDNPSNVYQIIYEHRSSNWIADILKPMFSIE